MIIDNVNVMAAATVSSRVITSPKNTVSNSVFEKRDGVKERMEASSSFASPHTWTGIMLSFGFLPRQQHHGVNDWRLLIWREGIGIL
mmetsp:Transcript_7035/g.15141  ORF Transcript_7035/g.15141 Transcript_7035/m.15141 type:complete len:87 (-) Transcript_7035:70-330(-)